MPFFLHLQNEDIVLLSLHRKGIIRIQSKTTLGPPKLIGEKEQNKTKYRFVLICNRDKAISIQGKIEG